MDRGMHSLGTCYNSLCQYVFFFRNFEKTLKTEFKFMHGYVCV